MHLKLTKKKHTKNKPNKLAQNGRCPVCNSILYGTEQVYSIIYKSDKKEKYCNIKGCPHCYPVLEDGLKRTCPVCHKPLASNEFLNAYLFTRPGQKNHIHITGCNNCGLQNR